MLDMLVVSVMLLFDDYNINILEEKGLDHILSNSISIFFVIIISVFSVINRKRNIYRENERIGVSYLILILLGEISIGGFITVLLYIDGKGNIFSVLVGISGIVFLVLSVVMIVNYTSKNHYKNISEINENLLKSQENYYTMLLQKDRDTIKFRHDISNHINCMYLLFENGQYDELKEYFDKIGASLSELRPAIQTGNDMVSAILNDSASKYPSVRYEIDGKMPNETRLNNMDICTIFSNLFDNAFNAASKSEQKLVTISFRFIGGNFFCEVKNTIDHKVSVTNNELITEKTDKANHGHGTYNARNCAEKNNGEITYSCDEKYFSAELVLPRI
ncbi:MAG: GHKL domain-containing protein [Ruminococcus sp.]|nr:GHKL domain-containing protein [Ruminococcus sp.]